MAAARQAIAQFRTQAAEKRRQKQAAKKAAYAETVVKQWGKAALLRVHFTPEQIRAAYYALRDGGLSQHDAERAVHRALSQARDTYTSALLDATLTMVQQAQQRRPNQG